LDFGTPEFEPGSGAVVDVVAVMAEIHEQSAT
jgi:hypothetical protein